MAGKMINQGSYFAQSFVTEFAMREFSLWNMDYEGLVLRLIQFRFSSLEVYSGLAQPLKPRFLYTWTKSWHKVPIGIGIILPHIELHIWARDQEMYTKLYGSGEWGVYNNWLD